MFRILSGNVRHAQNTIQVLNALNGFIQQKTQEGKQFTLKDLYKAPGFALLAKGDYKIQLPLVGEDGVTKRRDVFDGQTSYIDWSATVRYQMLIVMGLEFSQETPAAHSDSLVAA